MFFCYCAFCDIITIFLLSGSAMANSISQYALAVFLYVYIHWKGLHKATWDGKSALIIQNMKHHIYLQIIMTMWCV